MTRRLSTILKVLMEYISKRARLNKKLSNILLFKTINFRALIYWAYNCAQQNVSYNCAQQNVSYNRPQQNVSYNCAQQNVSYNRPQQNVSYNCTQQNVSYNRPQQNVSYNCAQQNVSQKFCLNTKYLFFL